MSNPKGNVPNFLYTHAKENATPPRPKQSGMKQINQNLNIPHPTSEPTMDEKFIRWRGEVDAHWGRGWAKYFKNEIARELVKAEAKQSPKEANVIRILAEKEALNRINMNENLDYLRAVLEVLKEGNNV